MKLAFISFIHRSIIAFSSLNCPENNLGEHQIVWKDLKLFV